MDMPGHGGGGHHGGGHGEMDMSCKMNMVWNTDLNGVCLVFPSLRISSPASAYVAVIAVFLLSVLYEYMRLSLSANDKALRISLRGQLGAGVYSSAPSSAMGRRTSAAPGASNSIDSRTTSPFVGHARLGDSEALLGNTHRSIALPLSVQLRRSLRYVVVLAMSSYLMLLLMTYNAYIIGAVLAGAGVGHLVFTRNFDLIDGNETDSSKSVGCH